MYPSSGSASAQVPAWKRLGLKLKQPAASSEPPTSSSTVGQPGSGKRKPDAPPTAWNSSHGAKRPRQGDAAPDRNGQLRKQKSVTFAETPADAKGARPGPKKSKGPAKKQTPPTIDLKPALEYLRLWKTARDSWKFNKNHQSSLIKHVFEANGIPAADVATFYEYIRDLKGFIRMRLRETAVEIRDQDQSQGAKAFPEGTKDLEATQARYESALAKFIDPQEVGSKRRAFDEPEYIASSDDGDVITQRLVKRMRAELVLDELSESGETQTSKPSSSAITTTHDQPEMTTDTTEKRAKPNEGAGKRRRKLRVNMDSSSSESESSDDDSDANSSSDDDDNDDRKGVTTQHRDDDTSSSSSSSSSDAGSDDDTSDED